MALVDGAQILVSDTWRRYGGEQGGDLQHFLKFWVWLLAEHRLNAGGMGGCPDVFRRFSQYSCAIGADDTNSHVMFESGKQKQL